MTRVRPGWLILATVMATILLAYTAPPAQVIIRPAPGANQSGMTVIPPTFTPPYRLTVRVYVTTSDGNPLPAPLGANVLVLDAQGKRVGMDGAGALHAEIPTARWEVVTNPQPNAPVGPRGLLGTGITLDDPADSTYVVEITGTERAELEIAIEQWDRTGQRRWALFSRASTEQGAVDRWDLPYTAANRPAFDLREQRDDSYLSIRAYGRRGDSVVKSNTELLLTDPRGRRLGQLRGHKVREIPRASYDTGTGDIEGRELEVLRPAAGDFMLDVVGTASGAYDFSVYVADRAGQSRAPFEITGVPIRAGETHHYSLRNDATPRLAGGLGHDARLLSYALPAATRVELPRGEIAVTLVILYAPTIARETFRATLGGRDVTSRFKPKPGGAETVRLPVAATSGTLVLSVQGNGLVHTDTFEVVRR